MKKSELMRVDPMFRNLVRELKKELDLETDRRTTKEIVNILTEKRKKKLIL